MIFPRDRIAIARRLWWPIAGAALLCLAGCAYSLVSGGRVNSRQSAKIEAGIQDIRQLRFKHPVPLSVKTPDEAEKMLEAEMMRENTEEDLRRDAVVGALVGLYPPNMDLKAEALKLMKSQVAGFYDQHEKQMVVVAGNFSLGFWNSATQFMIQRDIAGEVVLAHELTHALQDQNFDLESKMDKVKDDDDRALALKSVAEGDATLAGFAYSYGRMDDTTADVLLANLGDLPKALAAEAPNTPEGLSKPLLFQYTAGTSFVAEAYRRGGWMAVDALYSNPPQSSHQIMHPGLYFEGGAQPVRIALAGYEKIMAGWKTVDDESYGELLLKVILERNLGKQSSEVSLSTRWAADRMVVMQQSRGINLIWMIAFDNAHDASHFAVVYTTLLDRLLGDATPHRIDYRSNAVLILIGQSSNYFDALAPAIWKASAVEVGGVTAGIKPPVTREQ